MFLSLVSYIFLFNFQSIAKESSAIEIQNVIDNLKKTINKPFYILVKDIEKNEVIYVHDEYDIGGKSIPLGSLIKVFSVIAKFKNHPIDPSETHFCRGWNTDLSEIQCWLKKGHGNTSLVPAIANSCNIYFYNFVKDIDFSLFIDTLKEWDILIGSENWGKRYITEREQIMAMIGKMNILKLRPSDILESYTKVLFSDKLTEDIKEILIEGMSLCYRRGTASGAREKLRLSENLPIICKTGTGVFEKDGKIDIRKTNGSFIGILNNRYAVFVFVENSTGAKEPSEIGLILLKKFLSRNFYDKTTKYLR